MAYNLSLNISSVPDLFTATNSIIGNDIVPGFIILMIFAITMLATGSRVDTFEENLLYASWVTAISSVFVVIITEATAMLFILAMILLLVSLLIYKKGR